MPLTREEAFELWAPAASPWSVWAKPVLFAHLPRVLTLREAKAVSASPTELLAQAPASDGATLLVVDLPGVKSVQLGEALAYAGFRPVPLFNAVPGPKRDSTDLLEYLRRTLVDVYPIIDAIQEATPRLVDRLQRLPLDSPPAFLLDADRRLGFEPSPGDFDNRSVSLPTDFPSASLLQSRGVLRVLLVTEAQDPLATGGRPATDLAHTLLRWQSAGLEIQSCRFHASLEASNAVPIKVARPSRFQAIWHNALSIVGLRRSPLGGFGGKLPLPSSG